MLCTGLALGVGARLSPERYVHGAAHRTAPPRPGPSQAPFVPTRFILRSLVVVGALPFLLAPGCAAPGSGPVVAPAMTHVDQTEWDCTEHETILSPAKLGRHVNDGVGVGPIRLGDTIAHVVKHWGVTQCPPAAEESADGSS